MHSWLAFPAFLAAAIFPMFAGAQPDIVLEQREIDLGVWAGDAIERSITIPFRNAGDEPLLILKTGGCERSCDTDKERYEPGESGIVYVQWQRLLGLSPTDGFHECRPWFQTNDHEESGIGLHLTVDARPMVWTVVQAPSLVSVRKDECAPLTISVYSRGPDLELLDARQVLSRDDPRLDIEFGPVERLYWERTDEEITTRDVIVRLPPGAAIGLHSCLLEIAAPDTGPIPSFLSFLHTGDLQLEPRRVNLGTRKPGETVEFTVTVRSQAEIPFTILRVAPEPADPESKFEFVIDGQGKPATSHAITVRTAVSDDAERYRRRLRITTDVEREQTVFCYFQAKLDLEETQN